MSATGKGIDWRDPISWCIAACCVAEIGMNAVGGYDLLGGAAGGLKAKVIAIGGMIVAVLGAWAGKEAMVLLRYPDKRASAWAFIGGALVAFLLSQALAWRVLSSTFADGALRREVAGQSLQAKRDEIAKIGAVRAIGAIQAELDLELRRRSKQFPNGDGPAATKLRGELATAERKWTLEREIAAAQKQGGAMVAAGSENMIAGKVLGMSNEDSLLAIVLALSGLIGFFAYFGFALRELARGGSPGPGSGGGGEDDLAEYYRELGRREGYRLQGLPPPQGREQRIGAQRVTATEQGLQFWPAGSAQYPGGAGHAGGGESHAQAPVTINIGGVPAQGAHGVLPGAPQIEVAPPAGAVSVPQVAAPRGERVDLAALPADAPPVDRSQVPPDLAPEERAAADVLLAFKAACVVDAPSGLVSIVNLFRRYQVWAGERALEEPAFLQMFPRVTGVRVADIGGFLHACDVALRAAPSLTVASAA